MKVKRLSLLILAGIFLFFLINNYLWLKNDNTLQGVDVPNHLYFQLRFQDSLSHIIFNNAISYWAKGLKIIKLMNTPMTCFYCVYWPNLVFLSSSLFTLIFGQTLLVAKLSQSPYLLILLFATYYIGKAIGRDSTGLLSAFLISVYPMIFESSRQYSLDFFLTALVTLNILFLMRSHNFEDRTYSILAGICTGMGMLVKGQLILFIMSPLILILYNFLKQVRSGLSEKELQKRILNFFIFIIIAALIASVWWGNKIVSTIVELTLHTTSQMKAIEGEFKGKLYSLGSLTWNIKKLFFNSIGPLFFIIFIISLYRFVTSRTRCKGLLLSWLIPPILLFSVVFLVKQDRFLMPILPAIAILTAWAILQIGNPKFKAVVVSFLILICLFQYYNFSYFHRGTGSPGPILLSKLFGKSSYNCLPRFDAEKENLIAEAIEEINKYSRKEGPLKLGLVNCSKRIGTWEMFYWLYFNNRNLRLCELIETEEKFFQELPLFSALVYISDYEISNLPTEEEFLAQLNRLNTTKYTQLLSHYRRWHPEMENLINSYSKFTLSRSVEYKNGSHLFIYRRKQ